MSPKKKYIPGGNHRTGNDINPCYAQSSGHAADDIRALLPAGKRLASLFGPGIPELTPQEKELQARVMKAIVQNEAYFRDSSMTADPRKNFERLGLTQQELESYGKIPERSDSNIRITGTDSLEVFRDGKLIAFRGSGRLRPLDSLEIDLENMAAIFRGQRMPLNDEPVKSSDIPFKGPGPGINIPTNPCRLPGKI